jgi:hypothetical protein
MILSIIDDVGKATASNFILLPYLLINDKLIWLLWDVHEISRTCYYGGFEIFNTLY